MTSSYKIDNIVELISVYLLIACKENGSITSKYYHKFDVICQHLVTKLIKSIMLLYMYILHTFFVILPRLK
jgi:hypothetical protein